MNIALDYDETFTADRDLWTEFILNAKDRNHEVRFVTYRSQIDVLTNPSEAANNADIEADAKFIGIDIHYTSGKNKHQYCNEIGFKVHIWIDDMPWYATDEDWDKSSPQSIAGLAGRCK